MILKVQFLMFDNLSSFPILSLVEAQSSLAIAIYRKVLNDSLWYFLKYFVIFTDFKTYSVKFEWKIWWKRENGHITKHEGPNHSKLNIRGKSQFWHRFNPFTNILSVDFITIQRKNILRELIFGLYSSLSTSTMCLCTNMKEYYKF